jgi:hypothetical protein
MTEPQHRASETLAYVIERAADAEGYSLAPGAAQRIAHHIMEHEATALLEAIAQSAQGRAT